MHIINEIIDSILEMLNKQQDQLGEKEIINYLDYRDTSPFDEKWVKSYENVNSIKSNKDESFLNNEKNLREKVFKNVARITNNYELAEYISDDAGLIYSDYYFNTNDKFIKELYSYYKVGELPK
jgi:TnpA family transposase